MTCNGPDRELKQLACWASFIRRETSAVQSNDLNNRPACSGGICLELEWPLMSADGSLTPNRARKRCQNAACSASILSKYAPYSIYDNMMHMVEQQWSSFDQNRSYIVMKASDVCDSPVAPTFAGTTMCRLRLPRASAVTKFDHHSFGQVPEMTSPQ